MTDAHEHGHGLVALRARKAALRSLVLQRRDGLDPAARQAASRRIADAVLARDAFRAARRVMAYASFGSEVNTSVLCETVLREGKMLLLPRVDKTRDAIRVYGVRDLARDLDTNSFRVSRSMRAAAGSATEKPITTACSPRLRRRAARRRWWPARSPCRSWTRCRWSPTMCPSRRSSPNTARCWIPGTKGLPGGHLQA